MFYSLPLRHSFDATIHERFFLDNRKSAFGTSISKWLLSPEKASIKRDIRQSKWVPFVEEMNDTESNMSYAHVHIRTPVGPAEGNAQP